MVVQLGDRNVLFNSGNHNPGDYLQRKGPQGWQNFKVNGKIVLAPVDYYKLPEGQYRLVAPHS
jgi:hypothetical protein